MGSESCQSRTVLAGGTFPIHLCSHPPPYPTDKETEAQRGKATCSKAHAVSMAQGSIIIMTRTPTIARLRAAAVSGRRLRAGPWARHPKPLYHPIPTTTPRRHAVTVRALQGRKQSFREKPGAGVKPGLPVTSLPSQQPSPQTAFGPVGHLSGSPPRRGRPWR